jgi:hypothetical protein
MKIVQQTLLNLWAASDTGTHVALPLDASLHTMEQLEAMCDAFGTEASNGADMRDSMRAAIAALAAALGEEG